MRLAINGLVKTITAPVVSAVARWLLRSEKRSVVAGVFEVYGPESLHQIALAADLSLREKHSGKPWDFTGVRRHTIAFRPQASVWNIPARLIVVDERFTARGLDALISLMAHAAALDRIRTGPSSNRRNMNESARADARRWLQDNGYDPNALSGLFALTLTEKGAE